MSQTVLTLKQNIQYYGKRDSAQDISRAEDALLQEQLHLAKVTLVEQIKSSAYTLWELKELYALTDEYIVLTQKNIALYESYTSVSADAHMGIMKAELSLSDLKIQESRLKAAISRAYSRLSSLAALKVDDLEISLSVEQKPELSALQKGLDVNPQLLIKEREIQKQGAKVALADVNNYPDINLIAGYAYRENFDNYFNFGLAMTLPIYGTEDAKEQEARALQLESVSKKEETRLSINATLETYYAQMLSAYEIYHIVQDEALPQVAHMFELSSSSISTGGDLFKYIDVLFDKLALEKKSINAVSAYNKAQAKIQALSGALR